MPSWVPLREFDLHSNVQRWACLHGHKYLLRVRLRCRHLRSDQLRRLQYSLRSRRHLLKGCLRAATGVQWRTAMFNRKNLLLRDRMYQPYDGSKQLRLVRHGLLFSASLRGWHLRDQRGHPRATGQPDVPFAGLPPLHEHQHSRGRNGICSRFRFAIGNPRVAIGWPHYHQRYDRSFRWPWCTKRNLSR